MLADLFLGIVTLLVGITAASQVFIPLARGKRLFPSFSGRERRIDELKAELEELRVQNAELELQKQVDAERERNLQAQLNVFEDIAPSSKVEDGDGGFTRSARAQKGEK